MKQFIVIFLLCLISLNAQSETVTGSDKEFLFDAVVFKGEDKGKSRLDVFVVVPYQTLEFVKSGAVYGSKYDVFIEIYNIETGEVVNDNFSRTITADDYYIAAGGSAEFDYNQKIYTLPPGEYRLKITLSDKISNREYSRSRKVSVIDFEDFDFALSGLLLISSIEEANGKFKITPHISDDLGKLESDFFTFFECYNYKNINEFFLTYQILDSKDRIIEKGKIESKNIKPGTNQIYLKIPSPDNLSTGFYSLKIIALSSYKTDYDENDYIAVAQRSIRIEQSLIGNLLDNLDDAIRRLRYVAFQEEIDRIKDAPDRKEKEKRFLAFWKEKDPTPATDRNEAFRQYYSRIDYANRNFKSYTEGWMTDKGMVYVIFGPPYSAERQNRYGDNRVYEVWRYSNNREFVFVDNTGFGDFRLIRPATIVEKYEYKN